MNDDSYCDETKRQVEALKGAARTANRRCGERIDPVHGPEHYRGYGVDEKALDSAIGAAFQTIFGEPAFPTVFERAAALIVYLARRHAFDDGNKRTSLSVALAYLESRGVVVTAPKQAMIDLIQEIVGSKAAPRQEDIKRVAKLLLGWSSL
ncbi:type II toxin-antitoxin system death-on-curing family toxin [Corynebacterium frankenforstense]|uniref:type II toxin-antitoxin system death-on-curing family toxin n=1 Tax=Corynebacterium frankenforstense TaxID=1230998 RepID=UPI0009517792|nr:type II toxin-antitoxin system death-on-curing family toxin [Corynebacterium frankenforstense]